jgi:hypothetical protein
MKINATTLVEELKKEFKYQYDKDIAVHTPIGNIAGDRRKVRALTSKENVEFPVHIDSENAEDFIRQCKRKMGLKLTISEKNSESADFTLEDIDYSSVQQKLSSFLQEVFEKKDTKGCVEFNKRLVQFVNNNPHYYWLLYMTDQTLNTLGDIDKYDFQYSLSYFGLTINKEDFTIYFDENFDVLNAEAPFEQTKDFKWYSSLENKESKQDGGSFVHAILQKTSHNESDFALGDKSDYLFNFGISSFYISASNWIENSDLDSEDVVDGLATMIWTVLGSAGWENETLNEYTNLLPIFVVENLLGINTEEYNSEENDNYSSYRDYVIDWKSVAENIFEGPGFPINDNGPLGFGYLSEDNLQAYFAELTSESAIHTLPSGKEVAHKDLDEKMTIIDYMMICDVLKDGWRIANSSELKEMYSLKDNSSLNFDSDEAYISLDNLETFATGVLFFDDGEFDVRTNRLFAGKVRLIKG